MQGIQKAFVTHKSLKAQATGVQEEARYENTAEVKQRQVATPVVQPAAVTQPSTPAAKKIERKPSFRGDVGSLYIYA